MATKLPKVDSAEWEALSLAEKVDKLLVAVSGCDAEPTPTPVNKPKRGKK